MAIGPVIGALAHFGNAMLRLVGRQGAFRIGRAALRGSGSEAEDVARQAQAMAAELSAGYRRIQAAAPTGYNLRIDDSELQRKLSNLFDGLADMTPLMQQWAEIAQASIAENFERGGRPTWVPLSSATIKRKGHARPLRGRSGNLANITSRAERDRVTLSTHPATADYAAIHQYGGTIRHPGGTPFFIKLDELVFVSKMAAAAERLPKTKPHDIPIPARPYLFLQPEDEEEMKEAAREYFRRLAE